MIEIGRPLWIPNFVDYAEKMVPAQNVGPGTFASYICELNLNLASLTDKRILDMGSGNGFFGKTVRQSGIAKFVVNLDDGFVVKAMDVQGKAEFLPFKNESFDLVLDNGLISLLHFVNNRSDLMLKTLYEMLRVTSPGGGMKIQSIESAHTCWHWKKIAEETNRREIIMRELESIHCHNPELIIRIIKCILGLNDYNHLLEIYKP